MNIENLKVFLHVAETRQITHAAKLMHMTQPAVSAHIKALETTLQAEVFVRSQKGVTLTEVGERVRKHAENILFSIDEMKREASGISEHQKEFMNIGATQTIGNYVLPEKIAKFKKKYPRSTIKLEIADIQMILNYLTEQKIDIGIIGRLYGSMIDPVLFKEVVIGQDSVIFVTPKTPEWIRKLKKISNLRELQELPFIMPKENSCMWHVLKKEFNKRNISLDSFNTVYEVEKVESIKHSVISGIGFSVCSKYAVQNEIKNNTIKEFHVPECIMTVNLSIVYRANDFLSESCKNFIDFVESIKE